MSLLFVPNGFALAGGFASGRFWHAMTHSVTTRATVDPDVIARSPGIFGVLPRMVLMMTALMLSPTRSAMLPRRAGDCRRGGRPGAEVARTKRASPPDHRRAAFDLSSGVT
jgi:hypothetical protein